jgi:hypothetical protein
MLPLLIYLGFCLINLQSGPDLIPFFTFVGVFAGWFFVEGSRIIAGDRTVKLRAYSICLRHVIPAGALLLTLGLAFIRGHRYSVGEVWTLQREKQEARLVGAMPAPDDKMFVHGTVELLVLLNRPNVNAYVDLDAGKDDYIAQRNYGGSFQALIDEIESQRPKVVAVSRLRNVAHRAELGALSGRALLSSKDTGTIQRCLCPLVEVRHDRDSPKLAFLR